MTFDEIKVKYSIYDVATGMLGLQVRPMGDGEYRGVSIAPGQHSTDDAFSISGDIWYDHSAKIGGSVLDLVAFVKFGNNDTHSICEAAKFLAGDSYDSGYWTHYADQRDKFKRDVNKWHEALLADAKTLDYLHDRRITDDTIKRFKLGLVYEGLRIGDSYVQEWRLACPYFDAAGNPIYMASRRLDWTAHEGSPKYHKIKQNDFLKNAVFGLNTLPKKDADCDTLLIGEGMFDALTMAQAGYPVQFSIGGSFGKENDAIVLRNARKFRRIITCFDSDSAGQNFTIQQGKKFLGARLNFTCITAYGEGCKDVSDFYTTGGNIQELVSSASNGYEFMSRYTFWDRSRPKRLSEYFPFYSLSANEKAKSLGEVKKFVYALKTFLPAGGISDLFGGDMQHVIEALCEYYPQDKIAKFSEGPTAQEILCSRRDEFLEGRTLFYHGSIKHGEYWQYDNNCGYFYRMSDADLQAELSEFFKHELNNKDIAQLSMMIRLMVTKQVMPKFNKKRVQVFTNGTLELDTGILREHRAEDFVTWAHNFPYNEETKCPTYDAFLEQVTQGEQSRIDLLDDLPAYALYEDCRLEKMFILVGDGENGKGTYLKTIEALFTSSNPRDNSQSVTNIQPCEFDKPTERIILEGSMLNIAHDIDANLKGCASYLKSITSGDTITGNFKFCDSRSFSPRTKIVCSSNHMIKVDDDSYGMRRRLMFCKFAACFKGTADTGLLDKLKAELPGIFNRVYRAYQALREREKTQGNNAIRATIDQNAYISEFTNIANPVAAFWNDQGEEYLARNEVANDELFEAFREFCEWNRIPAGYKNTFHSNLKKVLQEAGIAFSNTRHREGDKQPYYYVFPKAQSTSSQQEDSDVYEQEHEEMRERFRIEAKLRRGIEWWRIGLMSLDCNEEQCIYTDYTADEVQELLNLKQYDIHKIEDILTGLCKEYGTSRRNSEGQTIYSLPHIHSN